MSLDENIISTANQHIYALGVGSFLAMTVEPDPTGALFGTPYKIVIQPSHNMPAQSVSITSVLAALNEKVLSHPINFSEKDVDARGHMVRGSLEFSISEEAMRNLARIQFFD